jgi:outer membrane receptor for monomeric catechols
LLVLPLSLALLLVAPMVSVEAPGRMLISGQSISCVVPVTDCWDVAVEREKKPENLSVKEGELDAGGAPAAGADGVPVRLVPEQPDASSATSSNIAIGARWLRRITSGTVKPGTVTPEDMK